MSEFFTVLVNLSLKNDKKSLQTTIFKADPLPFNTKLKIVGLTLFQTLEV